MSNNKVTIPFKRFTNNTFLSTRIYYIIVYFTIAVIFVGL